jgi:hypothetical protein
MQRETADEMAPRSAPSPAALAAYIVGLAVFAVPVVLQSWAQEVSTSRNRAVAPVVILSSLAVVGVAAAALSRAWPRLVSDIGNRGLATIGMISGLHFAVSYASLIAGSIVATVTGPFSVFITGVGDEMLPSLLMAVLIVLLPRVGVLTLSILVVFLLNGIVAGQFGLASILFVGASILFHEAMSAMLGVTGSTATSARVGLYKGAVPGTTAKLSSSAARVGLAIGLANSLTMASQYALFMALYRLHFDAWFIWAASLGPGLLYGAIGGALGARLAERLRRTAP